MSESNWSRSWQASKNPAKQRKYRSNAPHHQKKQFLSARLDDRLRERIGKRTVPARTGDRVEVLRGDYAGKRGEVVNIDTDDYRLYIEGVERETVSGSETQVAIDPSNVRLTRLNLDDGRRAAEFDISEAEKEEIRADTYEGEEATEDESAEDEETEAEDVEDEAAEEASADVDYEELVEGTVDDVKDAVRSQDLDAAKVLEAEQANKDRSTLTGWLENRTGGDTDE